MKNDQFLCFSLTADMGMNLYADFKTIFTPDVIEKYPNIRDEAANIYRLLRIEDIEQ